MEGVKSKPGSHVPRHRDGTGAMPASSQLALSGHTLVSIMPMMTHDALAEVGCRPKPVDGVETEELHGMRGVVKRRGAAVRVGRDEARRAAERAELGGGECRGEAVERLVVSVEEPRPRTVTRRGVSHGREGGGVPLAVVGVVRRHDGLVHVDNVRRSLGTHCHRSMEEHKRSDEKQ